MKKLCLLSILLIFSSVENIYAEDIFGNEDIGFGVETADGNIKNENKLSSFLTTKLPSSMMRNIEKAEKVFCYKVGPMDPNHNGYLIDGFVVDGFCGELSSAGQSLIRETLLNNNVIYSNTVDSCEIKPQIMLRYVYGTDHTDVLFSNPCPALIFFHGADVVPVNATPGKNILEKISTAYTGLTENYLSPALLDQLVGNGIIVTQAQKEAVRKQSSEENNKKKWGNEKTPSPAQQAQEPAKTGWNKLK